MVPDRSQRVCNILAPQKIPLESPGRLQPLQEPRFVVTLSSLMFSLTAGMEHFITVSLSAFRPRESTGDYILSAPNTQARSHACSEMVRKTHMHAVYLQQRAAMNREQK